MEESGSETKVFDRNFECIVYDFGVSGKLRNSGLTMYDRQAHNWWQQFTGVGLAGDLRAGYPDI